MIRPIKDSIWYNKKTSKPYLIIRVWFKGELASSLEIEDMENKKPYVIDIDKFYEKFKPNKL